MQFLVSVIDDHAGLASSDEMAAIDAFNDRLRANGHWVFAGGLGSPATAMVIDNRGGAGIAREGPLSSAQEHVAGFWIIEAPDHATARRLAVEGSRHCNRKVELRAFLAP
jgi:hypothetical protein